MAYLCPCPAPGLFEGADGTIRCPTCATREEMAQQIRDLGAQVNEAHGELDELRAAVQAFHRVTDQHEAYLAQAELRRLVPTRAQ